METLQTQKVKNFISDIIKLSETHGLSISHEDGHGGFIIEVFNEHNTEWLSNAHDGTQQGNKNHQKWIEENFGGIK